MRTKRAGSDVLLSFMGKLKILKYQEELKQGLSMKTTPKDDSVPLFQGPRSEPLALQRKVPAPADRTKYQEFYKGICIEKIIEASAPSADLSDYQTQSRKKHTRSRAAVGFERLIASEKVLKIEIATLKKKLEVEEEIIGDQDNDLFRLRDN